MYMWAWHDTQTRRDKFTKIEKVNGVKFTYMLLIYHGNIKVKRE